MSKVQAEFGNTEAAQRAVKALKAAGVPADRIRVWNIIPEGGPARPSTGATTAGTVAGGLAGGLGGALIGRAAGRALDAMLGPERNIPEASGVRVVVDGAPEGVDVAGILHREGGVRVG